MVLSCTARPPSDHAEAEPEPKATPPIVEPSKHPTRGEPIRGRVSVASTTSAGQPPVVWFEPVEGERWILTDRPEPWLVTFDGAQVEITGERYTPQDRSGQAPQFRIFTIARVDEGMSANLVKVGPEIELKGRFEVDIGEPGTKSEGERTLDFVAEDGRGFMVHNLADDQLGAPAGRSVGIRAREVELSPYAAHRTGPRVWVTAIDDLAIGDAGERTPKATPTTTPYATTSADLDGDGKAEVIALGNDGRLAIGAASETLAWIHPEDSYWRGLDRENRLSIVELDGKRRGVMFWQFEEGDVDPDKRYEVFGYRDGAIKRLTPAPVPASHASEVSVGTGRVTIVEDFCEQDATIGDDGKPRDDGKSRRTTRTLRYDRARDLFVVEQKATSKRSRCLMAACPFVEVDGQRVGEILRRLSEPVAEGTQSLALPASSGRVSVTLVEEKPEWTMLDAVALRVDGTIVHPLECAGTPTLCADDGVVRTLAPGERMTLTFDVEASSDVVLLVDGHYLPLDP